MLWLVVEHMAALTKSAEVGSAVVRRVTVEVRRGEHDTSRQRLREQRPRRPAANCPTIAVPPRSCILVKPPAVAKVLDRTPMGSLAVLAAPAGYLEPDNG